MTRRVELRGSVDDNKDDSVDVRVTVAALTV